MTFKELNIIWETENKSIADFLDRPSSGFRAVYSKNLKTRTLSLKFIWSVTLSGDPL